jgi:hypothetical protein
MPERKRPSVLRGVDRRRDQSDESAAPLDSARSAAVAIPRVYENGDRQTIKLRRG